MIIRYYRPSDTPDVVALINGAQRLQTTVDAFRRREQRWPAGDFRLRLVAEAEQRTVATGCLSYTPYAPSSYLSGEIVVGQQHQRHGFGTRILIHLVDQARLQGAEGLVASVRDDIEANVNWTERRGFIRHAHRFESHLNLATFDFAKHIRSCRGLKPHGITFMTMTGQDDKGWRRLFDLFRAQLQEAPDMQGLPPWDEALCRQVLQNNENAPPGWIMVAVLEGNWIAVSVLHKMRDEAYSFFTGVDLRFRGLGIARCLKTALAVRAAAEGISGIRTNNLESNKAMIAVNRSLGFVAEPGFWDMRRLIG